jgi:putative flippase GtrA
MKATEYAVIVPAYCPGDALENLALVLSRSAAIAVIVVDDGSGTEHRERFNRIARLPKVHMLRHAVNLGKGAALKAAFNYALCTFPGVAGVVTADADGQHAVEDIQSVGASLTQHPDSMILGARRFDAADVPLRSRAGNKITRVLVQVLIGQRLSDTQTGLRGIPSSLLPSLLRVAANGYDFELEMLIAAKQLSCPVREEPARTIYIEGNKSSHFNPLIDSLRIYFTLLRFSILSLLTALLDNLVFLCAFSLTGAIASAMICGRLVAVLFNYASVRKLVFLSRQSHRTVLPRYSLLVLSSGLLSYSLIRLFTSALGMRLLLAKLLAEGLIFIANFAIQRDFIFSRRAAPALSFAARLATRHAAAVLPSLLREHMDLSPRAGVVVEIGGADGRIIDRIQHALHPRHYYVIGSASALRARAAQGHEAPVQVLGESVLNLSATLQADLVFSAGLIEPLTATDTRRAVLAHFDLLRPGGCAILTIPTATIFSRVARLASQRLGLRGLPKPRRLDRKEVLDIVRERGKILHETALWPLLSPQALIVARKQAASAHA